LFLRILSDFLRMSAFRNPRGNVQHLWLKRDYWHWCVICLHFQIR
jgi:hypothetical protein